MRRSRWTSTLNSQLSTLNSQIYFSGGTYETYRHHYLSKIRGRLHRSGAGCFSALNRRKGAFERYHGEEVELEAFMKCSGCGHLLENDKGLVEKVRQILEIHPDAIHLGICCCDDGRSKELCPEIEALADVFRSHGIEVVRGTHGEF
ncbi:CGGC domain-containing protein [Dialister succinatiphilus]|uniref:CGGC domain-containing protein n=1 Tax=Dialister succinatiphilus TaxID=487173 RepID=UPI004026C31A